jgi:hypothetical protein
MFEETDLYPPVKSFMEALGYEVKAEINSCDVVAKKPDGSLVIIELKKGFNLDLLIQGVERLSLADEVYIAAGFFGPIAKGSIWSKRRRGILKLCRRLGLGLMMVNLFDQKDPKMIVLLDPSPYVPRKNSNKVGRLKKEFNTRIGDPNEGGATMRSEIMTSYRQSAILCAKLLSISGPLRAKDVKDLTGVEKAGNLMRNNHYGWFEKINRGVYELTEKGKKELQTYFKD